MNGLILRADQRGGVNVLHEKDKGIINMPTGTGKTIIQSTYVSEDIQKSLTPGVYVVLSPRILLSNQLFLEFTKTLIGNNIDCQYLIVHSGRKADTSNLKWAKTELQLVHRRDYKSTTSSLIIKEEYERAQREGIPLIISSTYDSAQRIVDAGIPIKVCLCDEAHNLVPSNIETGFSWIATDKFPSLKKFFFTATLKFSRSDEGYGMNSDERFGGIIFQKLPVEMIKVGAIIRPRVHLVDTSVEITDNIDASAKAIVEAFEQHRSQLRIGAKMLVVAQGSEHLEDLVNSKQFKDLQYTRPTLRIFDISSAYKPRVNGVIVERDDFLKQLREMDDKDEAIIIHLRILSEGIDVPGITGVMPLNNMSLTVFLQTLGRATRLHLIDRLRLQHNEITPTDVRLFIKPYAWLIVPVYGELGEEMRSTFVEIISRLRTFGFNPMEDIYIRASKGQAMIESLEQLNKKNSKVVEGLIEYIGSIEHEIEQEEKADLLDEIDVKINRINELEELITY